MKSQPTPHPHYRYLLTYTCAYRRAADRPAPGKDADAKRPNKDNRQLHAGCRPGKKILAQDAYPLVPYQHTHTAKEEKTRQTAFSLMKLLIYLRPRYAHHRQSRVNERPYVSCYKKNVASDCAKEKSLLNCKA